MARSFTSGNYLVSPGAVTDLAQDSTIFFRFKPTWSSGDSASHQMFEFWTDINNRVYFVKHSDNLIYGGCSTSAFGGPLNTLSDSGLFTSGAWANWRHDVSGSTGAVHLYKDDAFIGTFTHTSTFTPTSGMGLTFGDQTSLGRPADGDMAEFAYWNRLLSADERAVLQVSGCPLSVPNGLIAYYPIIGRNSPETDIARGLTLTLTAPAAAPHPRIFLPYAQSDYFVAGALTHYSLTADVGAFTLSGQAANLLYGRKLTSDVGTFALSGQAANLLYARLLAADVGAFTLAGQDAGLLKGKTLTADVGTFALAGQDVEFRKGYAITADTGVFTESGQAADLRTTKILSAAHGSFTLSGQDATLTAAEVVTIPSGRLFRVSRETRIFRVPPQ